MRFAAVAWDIDGTLVDSEPLHLVALQDICGRHGLDITDRPDDLFRGVHMHDVWSALRADLPGDLSRDRWLNEITDTYVSRVAELALIDGVTSVVAELASLGLRQICVSNSSRRIVDANIEALGITRFLDSAISFDDVSRGKPDPEPYRMACARLGLRPSEVVAVEDSQTGARSARDAGLFVIGFCPERQAIGDVDATVTSLRDIPFILSEGGPRRPPATAGDRAPTRTSNSEV